MKLFAAVIVLASVACTGGAGEDVHAPTIASVAPTHANPGTLITISGNSFCQQPPLHDEDHEIDPLACYLVGTVQFGTAQVAAAGYTETSIMVEVPSGESGPMALFVLVAGRTSNSVDFVIE